MNLIRRPFIHLRVSLKSGAEVLKNLGPFLMARVIANHFCGDRAYFKAPHRSRNLCSFVNESWLTVGKSGAVVCAMPEISLKATEPVHPCTLGLECATIALYFANYNFVRFHKTLRNPAMAAGVNGLMTDYERWRS